MKLRWVTWRNGGTGSVEGSNLRLTKRVRLSNNERQYVRDKRKKYEHTIVGYIMTHREEFETVWLAKIKVFEVGVVVGHFKHRKQAKLCVEASLGLVPIYEVQNG